MPIPLAARLLMFVAIIASLLAFGAHAANDGNRDHTCCICEHDNEMIDFYEKPMYKLACALKLMKMRGCDLKKTVEHPRYNYWLNDHQDDQRPGVLSQIPGRCDGGLVRMVYVGHWASTRQTIQYLERVYQEGVLERSMSFDIDNTGCMGTEDSVELERFFATLSIPQGQYIRFQGSQVTSISLWDNFFGPLSGRVNFVSHYDTREGGGIRYPSCSEYRGYHCATILDIQGGERATCVGEDGQLEQLVCCTMTRRFTSRLNRSRTELREITADMWLPEDRCSHIPTY